MKHLVVLSLLFLTGCASIPMWNDSCTVEFAKQFGECREEPEIIQLPTYEQLLNFPPAEVMPVVAVYDFQDLTGQRKRRDNLADFSTAVTQGATEILIDALKTAAQGKWFRVVVVTSFVVVCARACTVRAADTVMRARYALRTF